MRTIEPTGPRGPTELIMKRFPRSQARLVASLGFLATILPACGYGQSSGEGTELPKSYPQNRRAEISEVLHGTVVKDPYRWLEDLRSQETQSWVRSQDQRTAQDLESSPAFSGLRNRLLEILDFERFSNVTHRGDRFFIRRSRGNGTGGVVLVQQGAEGPRRVLVNPHDLFPGEERVLGQIAPSPDGRLLAFGTAPTGTAWTRFHLIDVDSGDLFPETLEGLNTRIGQVAWTPESDGFYYTRWPLPGGKTGQEMTYENAAIYFHRVGTPQSEDHRILATPHEPDRWFSAQVTEEGRYLVIHTALARDPGVAIRVVDLRSASRAPRALVESADHNYSFLGSRGNELWYQTDAGAPRGRIVLFDLSKAGGASQEVIPERAETLNHASLVADHFLLGYNRDALPIVKVFDLSGQLVRDQELPKTGAIWGGFAGRRTDRRAVFNLSDLADPGTYYLIDPASGRIDRLLRPDLAFDPEDFELRQVFYPGKDGTRIPMFLAHNKSVDPKAGNPVFLYAYGAFNWSAFPWFQPLVVAFMERGGVYAMANIRGGGEYGENWRQAGIRRNKQTGVDDLIAAAEWLIEQRYTSKQGLAVNGGSASGFLAAAAMVQRPDLFGGAVIDIPALDLVRFERFTGGAYWVPELGTVDDPEEFRSLLALSPYHNLRPGACYPPTLLTAGERDEITVPSHAYKFLAALQASQGCDHPAILQVVWGAGHSFGNDAEQSATTSARIVTFLARHLELQQIHRPGLDVAGN